MPVYLESYHLKIVYSYQYIMFHNIIDKVFICPLYKSIGFNTRNKDNNHMLFCHYCSPDGDKLSYRCDHWGVAAMWQRILMWNILFSTALTHCGLLSPYGNIVLGQHCLSQVMACCLTASSNYLDQCWIIVIGVLWHSPQNNFTRSAHEL